jgi:hypothetical protein
MELVNFNFYQNVKKAKYLDSRLRKKLFKYLFIYLHKMHFCYSFRFKNGPFEVKIV